MKKPRSPHPWGIKCAYNLLKVVAEPFSGPGRLSRPKLISSLGGRKAAADAGAVTLVHLGFATRSDGIIRLTEAGIRWIEAGGKPEGADLLAKALLNHDPFREIWKELIDSGKPVVQRSDVMKLLQKRYNYSPTVIEHDASFVLSFATPAGLCSKRPGHEGYALNEPRFREITKGPPGSAPPTLTTMGGTVETKREVQSQSELRGTLTELNSWLGWALADERVFTDLHRRSRISRLAEQLVQESVGTPWEVIASLAADHVLQALRANDRASLQWAIRTLHGIHHAEELVKARKGRTRRGNPTKE